LAAITVFAPAKINLYLHVTGRRADGYHLVDSLVAFADIGDRVTARPAPALSLQVAGPEAGGIPSGADNLIWRAAQLLAEHAGIAAAAALCLEKNLPVASGIGGGSSDAAAVLRALCRLWRLEIEVATIARLGARLGADIPVCVHGCAAWVGGIGEQIDPASALPEAGIVLANPRRRLPTAAVFKARTGPFSDAAKRFSPIPINAMELAAALAVCRNDLTAAALTLVPEIGNVLAVLRQLPGSLLARMSGSGATCFALFADRETAERVRAELATAEPGWWSAAGALIAANPIGD
jgi:4-diphosphocytidyl-2-C-methyl-D-erythritol kinase